MKKKFYYRIALLVSIAIVSTYVAKQEAKLPQLLKANIEASADNESGIVKFPCYSRQFDVCKFKAMDALGNLVTFNVDNYKHI